MVISAAATGSSQTKALRSNDPIRLRAPRGVHFFSAEMCAAGTHKTRVPPGGGVPIALAGPCAGTAGLMRDGRLVQFGELCGVSADVRFAPDFVRFTPNSGRGKHPRGTSQFDPERPFIGDASAARRYYLRAV